MYGLSELASLEAAARRVEDLAGSEALSDEARLEIAFAMSELVPVFDMTPGPVVAVLKGADVDVESCAQACAAALGQLVSELQTGSFSTNDIIMVSAAIGDAMKMLPALQVQV